MYTPVWSCKLKGKNVPRGFSIGTTIRGHKLTDMSKIETNEPVPSKKVAKIATKNRQNRPVAEFRQDSKPKVVGDLILYGKLVLQASIDLTSPK